MQKESNRGKNIWNHKTIFFDAMAGLITNMKLLYKSAPN